MECLWIFFLKRMVNGYSGQSIEYTRTKTIDGIMRAEVKSENKTGWVMADFLKLKRSSDMPYGVDLSDHEGLQKEFYSVRHPNSTPGDFDGIYDLQCPDLPNWFLEKYTTLEKSSGDGCTFAANVAAKKNDLEISNIPSAPAIYSVAPYSEGPGISKERATQWGHTGVILECHKVPKKDNTYLITYFHTGLSFKGKNYNCAITTKEFKVSDAVTFVNIGKYIK